MIIQGGIKKEYDRCTLIVTGCVGIIHNRTSCLQLPGNNYLMQGALRMIILGGIEKEYDRCTLIVTGCVGIIHDHTSALQLPGNDYLM